MHERHLLRVFALTAVLVLSLFALSFRDGRTKPAEAAVYKIQYSLGCNATGASIQFYWYGQSSSARQIWLDMSTYVGYWDPGTFVGAGPFSASTSSYEWKGLTDGATYYVRVNQQLASGAWDPSETFGITIDC